MIKSPFDCTANNKRVAIEQLQVSHATKHNLICFLHLAKSLSPMIPRLLIFKTEQNPN